MITIETSLDTDEAMMCIQPYMAKQRWTLAHKDEFTMTFTRTIKPDVIVTIILLGFFILPGVLHLIYGWRKKQCLILIKRKDNKTVIKIDGDLDRGMCSAIAKKVKGKMEKTKEVKVFDELVYVIFGGIIGSLIISAAFSSAPLTLILLILIPASSVAAWWYIRIKMPSQKQEIEVGLNHSK